jgi:hypothetical protein
MQIPICSSSEIVKIIGLFLIIPLLSLAVLSNLQVQLVQAFHEDWDDWDDDNFVERWYETEYDLFVKGVVILWGQSINSEINKCINVLDKIGGSKNCDRIMLQQENICENHFNMFNECNDGRLEEYLSNRGL